jgi:hypothetical protein
VTEDRQRVDRKDEELERRRARLESSIDGAKNLKLAIPTKIQQQLDEEGRVGRWVSDDPVRQYQVTEQNDYRRVDGVEPISTRNGKGEPMKLILMSKRKDFLEDDKRIREEKRRATEEAQLSAADAGAGFYADKANKFTRGGSG